MSTYTLEATEEQFQIINKALDFFSRIQMGQISELTNPNIIPLPDANYNDVDEKVLNLKKSMFPELSTDAYYTIKSKKIPDSVRQAIDIMEVIKYKLTIENSPERQIDKPFHWSNEMSLPSLKKVD